MRKVYNHYESWLNYVLASRKKLVLAQFPAPDKYDPILAAIDIVYTQIFVDQLKSIVPDLDQYRSLHLIQGACESYTQQIEKHALLAERQVETKIAEYQQLQQIKLPSFIPAYYPMESDIEGIIAILGDKYNELLARATPIADEEAFAELSRAVLGPITGVVKKWKTQFYVALNILDTKWEQVHRYYFDDKMKDIEEVRKYVSDCTSVTSMMIVEVTNYSEGIRQKVTLRHGTVEKLETVLSTMEEKLKRYFECIKNQPDDHHQTSVKDGPSNMAKLIKVYSTFGHQHRITNNQIPPWGHNLR